MSGFGYGIYGTATRFDPGVSIPTATELLAQTVGINGAIKSNNPDEHAPFNPVAAAGQDILGPIKIIPDVAAAAANSLNPLSGIDWLKVMRYTALMTIIFIGFIGLIWPSLKREIVPIVTDAAKVGA